MNSLDCQEKDSGIVHVAVFEEILEGMDAVDIVGNTSSDIFFDFSRALRLMNTPVWGSSIKTSTDSGFFVLSSPKK